MNLFKKLHIYSLITMGIVALCQADQRPSENTFRVLSWDGQISEIFYDFEKTEYAIGATEGSPSLSMPLPSNGTITLYQKRPINDVKFDKVPLVTLKSPSTGNRKILLLTYTKDKKLDGRWFSYDLDQKNNPTIHLLNLSSEQIGVKLNDQIKEMAILEEWAFQCKPNDELQCRIVAKRAGVWKPIWAAAYLMHEKMYLFGIIRDGRKSDGDLISEIELVPIIDYPTESNEIVTQ
jgi:hypothetical protein